MRLWPYSCPVIPTKKFPRVYGLYQLLSSCALSLLSIAYDLSDFFVIRYGNLPSENMCSRAAWNVKCRSGKVSPETGFWGRSGFIPIEGDAGQSVSEAVYAVIAAPLAERIISTLQLTHGPCLTRPS